MIRTNVSSQIFNPRFSSLGAVRLDFSSCLEQAEYAHKIVSSSYSSAKSSYLPAIEHELRMIKKGDPTLIAEAQALIEQINAKVEVLNPVWHSDYVGAMPDVPAFISGVPECMRRKVYEFKDHGTIKVFLSVACSSGITEEMMKKRGIAVLAMVMLLRSYRPIELYLFSESAIRENGHRAQVLTTKIDLDTVDLSSFCYCTSSVSRYRSIEASGIGCERLDGTWQEYNDAVEWAWGCKEFDTIGVQGSPYRNAINECLDAGPQDLVLPPVIWKTEDMEMILENPVQWVQKQIDDHATNLEEIYL